ncbi:DUF3108 domain-containing protein [bacterium]|nr:MAG: DUF3108 domain-containing protein [bacterium]
MKKTFMLFAIAAVLSVVLSARQNDPAAILSKLKSFDQEVKNKQFSYRIYLLGIFPVGRAVLTDEGQVGFRGLNLYHLSAKADSVGIVSKIYPFSANMDSYLEPKSLFPLIFLQAIKTNDKEIVKEVTYDQSNHIMQIKEERRSIMPETREPLSALLKLRGLDLDKTTAFDLNINTNQKNYAFSGVVKKGMAKLGEKNIELYRLSAKIFRRDKNPYHQSKVDFIFLNDEQKTPIFIKVFASGGLITARLVGVK